MARSAFNFSPSPDSWATADDGAHYLVRCAAELTRSDRFRRLSDPVAVESLAHLTASVARFTEAELRYDPRALVQRALRILVSSPGEQVAEHAARAATVAVYLGPVVQESSPLLDRLRRLASEAGRFYNKRDILGIVHRRLGTAALTSFFVANEGGVSLAEPVTCVVKDFEAFLGRVGPDEEVPADVDPEVVMRAKLWLRAELPRRYERHIVTEAFAAAVMHLHLVLLEGRRPTDPAALLGWCCTVLIRAASREAARWYQKPWEPIGHVDPPADPDEHPSKKEEIDFEAALRASGWQVLRATRGSTRRRIARLVIEATSDDHAAAREMVRELIDAGAIDRDDRGNRLVFLNVAAVLCSVEPDKFQIGEARPDEGVWRTVRRWVVEQLIPGLRNGIDGGSPNDDDDPDDGLAAAAA